MCNTVLYARYNISTIFHKKKFIFLYNKQSDNHRKSPDFNTKEAIQSHRLDSFFSDVCFLFLY